MQWMSMRTFLRGGYKNLEETTVISNHGRPVFTVFPYNSPNGSTATFADEPVVVRSVPGDGAAAPPRSAGVSEA